MRHGPAGVPAADRALSRPAAAGAGGPPRAGSAGDPVCRGIAGEPGEADRLSHLTDISWQVFLPVSKRRDQSNLARTNSARSALVACTLSIALPAAPSSNLT